MYADVVYLNLVMFFVYCTTGLPFCSLDAVLAQACSTLRAKVYECHTEMHKYKLLLKP